MTPENCRSNTNQECKMTHEMMLREKKGMMSREKNRRCKDWNVFLPHTHSHAQSPTNSNTHAHTRTTCVLVLVVQPTWDLQINKQVVWECVHTAGKQGLLLMENQISAHFRTCWEQTQKRDQQLENNVFPGLVLVLKYLSHVSACAHSPPFLVWLFSISLARVLALSRACSISQFNQLGPKIRSRTVFHLLMVMDPLLSKNKIKFCRRV